MLLNEAQNRGYDVTAIVRSPEKLHNQHVPVIQKDLFDLTVEDIRDFDVVIDSFGVSTEDAELFVSSAKHLIDLFEQVPDVRWIKVGGAGSLYMDETMSLQLCDTEDFPASVYPIAKQMALALALIRESDTNWTFLSPPIMFIPDGPKTGMYQIGSEVVPFNEKNESTISYADYAIALLDEVVNKAFIQKRFTVYH